MLYEIQVSIREPSIVSAKSEIYRYVHRITLSFQLSLITSLYNIRQLLRVRELDNAGADNEGVKYGITKSFS